MPIISVKNIDKFYGKKQVLSDVSFDIEKGEIFGLLGSNGAGKSTLTKIILGLEEATDGEVLMFGSAKRSKQKAKFSLVPQDDSFYKDFTVKKNMTFFASIYGVGGALRKKRVDFLLSWLELSNFSNLRADFLSGGYQKLLNIAISLIQDPEVIFMDEPTVGLDPRMRQLFWNKILELKRNGKTIILTTHYMDEAEELCNRVALLKNGKLIALGKPVDLIKQHGGIKVVVFRLSKSPADLDVEMIKMMAASKSVVVRGNYLIIPFSQEDSIKRLAGVTELLMKKGYNILSSTEKEPDLEDVFLNIVGENMSD